MSPPTLPRLPLSERAQRLGLDRFDPDVRSPFFERTPRRPFDNEAHFRELKSLDDGGLDLARSFSGLLRDIGLLKSVEEPTEAPTEPNRGGPIVEKTWVDTVLADDLGFLLSLAPPELVNDDLQPLIQKPPPSPVPRLLSILGSLALEPPFTLPVACHFSVLLPDLAARWLLYVGLRADGTYPEEFYDLWPAALPLEVRYAQTNTDDDEMNDVTSGLDPADGAKREAIKARVLKVFHAFATLVRAHESLFPFLVLFMRHPALSEDPFSTLPSSLSLDSLAQAEPPSSHAVFTSPQIPIFLLSLLRLLSVLPHLPFPGLVPSGWTLPSSLTTILHFHPRIGQRLLAWSIWRFWIGHDAFATYGEEIKHRYVWKPPQDQGEFTKRFECPWPDWAEDPTFELGKPGRELPEEFIPWSEELTGRWQVRRQGLRIGVVCEIAMKVTDAWILGFTDEDLYEDHVRAVDEADFAAQSSGSAPSMPLPVQSSSLTPLIVDVQGILAIRESVLSSSSYPNTPHARALQSATPSTSAATLSTWSLSRRPFVLTSTAKLALRLLAWHVSVRRPVLLSGPPSSGKSSLVEYLSSLMHSSSAPSSSRSGHGMVVLSMASRTLDAKSMLGSWASDPKDPGKFIFVEGPVVRAMKEGRWLVCEDVDKGAEDVLSVINLLADSMRTRSRTTVGGAFGGHAGDQGIGIDLGAQGGWVAASEGFALIATRSLRHQRPSREQERSWTFLGEQYWESVQLQPPTEEEVERILLGSCPRLSELSLAVLSAWKAVAAGLESWKQIAGSKRPVGLRELLRWARRVESLLPPTGSAAYALHSNPVLQDEIFLEGADVFFASLPSDDASAPMLLQIAAPFGACLGMGEERVEYCLARRTPDFVPAPAAAKEPRVLRTGRVSLRAGPSAALPSRPFALTKTSLQLLERLAAAIRSGEAPLMVGETGTGKTAVTSFLASSVGKRLVALNLSNQSEASDLLGGFKPIDPAIDARARSAKLIETFIRLFGEDFNLAKNNDFVVAMRKSQAKARWARLVAMWREAARMLSVKREKDKQIPAAADQAVPAADTPAKRRRLSKSAVPRHLTPSWRAFLTDVSDFEDLFVRPVSGRVQFTFVEGPLVAAIRNGDWILLDEINLATVETLEALTSLLHHPDSSVVLSERGDIEPIGRHPDFRLFGCMNPATDVGKRDLPSELRSRFTEVFVAPPDADRDGLLAIISGYLGASIVGDKRIVSDVADFYAAIRSLAKAGQLADGTNAPPHYSMRTLSRALTFAVEVAPSLGLRRGVLEGLTMAFATLLGQTSAETVQSLLATHIVSTARNPRVVVSQQPKPPQGDGFVRIGPFYLKSGPLSRQTSETYVVTQSVQTKMVDLARAITTGQYPVLIQGPTSSGKTSIIEHLARLTGHRFVRINNHEHTDIQEYIGTYAADPETGRLVFSEGILVRALKQGDWVVLDELNLAPSDVLEALNRLLDDNRELFVAETQEVVRPHPHFMLFATQNPPGLYGGRKVLSRAFRNRFLELHFDDVPRDELETILCQRCRIAPSYAAKVVAVFVELQRRRQTDRVFEHRQSFVTLRDLFRWGGRGAVGYQQLAEDGFMLLAERSRRPEDAALVRTVIEQVMRVSLDPAALYGSVTLPSSMVDTFSARRLCTLVSRALAHNEPVLLVGEPGSGKTSVCEALAAIRSQPLRTINLHQNSEVADLLGSQRPVRTRSDALRSIVSDAVTSALLSDVGILPDIAAGPHALVDELSVRLAPPTQLAQDLQESLRALKARLVQLTAFFAWVDGPVVQAMREGDLVLLDEISLADDSVLERLNSLLEPERTLVLAEKASQTSGLSDVRIVAHDSFELMATMNPGGDYGKKELSPALRNRFTEIWVPVISDPADRLAIYAARLESKRLGSWAEPMLSFCSFYSSSVSDQLHTSEVTLRDGLAWCDLLAASSLDAGSAFVHGARLAVLDRLGTTGFGEAVSRARVEEIRRKCLVELCRLAAVDDVSTEEMPVDTTPTELKVGPFILARHPSSGSIDNVAFTLSAPTVRRNVMRILRALEIPKSLLLEGSPGVGKTSTVVALAKLAGRPLHRINLSDQSDLFDLFGADVPTDGGAPGEFGWKDAAFLDAMKRGEWVLLDEMNLAPQQVLEGLNACLDHRGTVYVPELGRSFVRHPDFRVFAAQNPHHQGGSRKGLPRSLVDRFTVVFMDALCESDLMQICASQIGSLSGASLAGMVEFNERLNKAATVDHVLGAAGAPWEFNLRDLKRWLQTTKQVGLADSTVVSPLEHFDLIYTSRFRTPADRRICSSLLRETFPASAAITRQIGLTEAKGHLLLGHALLSRDRGSIPNPVGGPMPRIPAGLLAATEGLIECLRLQWLPILVGPPGSGKTTIVSYVAHQTGANWRRLALNAGSDTSDFLGGFEQSQPKRTLLRLADSLCRTVEAACRRAREAAVDIDARMIDAWRELHPTVMAHLPNRVILDRLEGSLPLIESFAPSDEVARLGDSLNQCKDAERAPRFEWVDGPLVSAMKYGDWLVVENANLCSNSVLDRLNPLFEGECRLVLTERGMVDGQVQTLAPHPNFRIIFTLDPRHGELSRAMRNRGIEIAVLEGGLAAAPMFGRRTNVCAIVDQSRNDTAVDLMASPDHTMALGFLMSSPVEVPRSVRQTLQRASGHDGGLRLLAAAKALFSPTPESLLWQIAMALRVSLPMTNTVLDGSMAIADKDPRCASSAYDALRLVTTLALSVICHPSANHVRPASEWGDFSNVITWLSSILFNAASSGISDHLGLSTAGPTGSPASLRQVEAGLRELSRPTTHGVEPVKLLFIADLLQNVLTKLPSHLRPAGEDLASSLAPLRQGHDRQATQALVALWTLFCEKDAVPPGFADAVADLTAIASDAWLRIGSEIRMLYLDLRDSLSHGLPSVMDTDKIATSLGGLASRMRLVRHKPDDGADDLLPIAANFEAFALAAHGLALVAHKDRILPTHRTTLADLAVHSGIGTPALHSSFRALTSSSRPEDPSGVEFNAVVEFWEFLTNSDGPKFEESQAGPFPLLVRLQDAVLLRSTFQELTRSLAPRLQEYQRSKAVTARCGQLLAASVLYAPDRRDSLRIVARQLALALLRSVRTSIAHYESFMRSISSDMSADAFWHNIVLAAVALWRVIAPSKPVDPLAAVTVERTFYRSAWADLRSLESCLSVFESRHEIGTTARRSQVGVELTATEAVLETLPAPPVDRTSNVADFQSFARELKSFGERFIEGTKLDQLLGDILSCQTVEALNMLQSRVSAFAAAASGLMVRLRSSYSTLADLLRPAQAILKLLQGGCLMSFEAAKERVLRGSPGGPVPVLSALLQASSVLSALDVINLGSAPIEQGLRAQNVRDVHLVQLAALAATPKASRPVGYRRRVLELYDRLWQLWAKDRLCEEKAAQEASQQFRQRATAPEDGEDSTEEEDLAALFPSDDQPSRTQGLADGPVMDGPTIATVVELHTAIENSSSQSCGVFDALRLRLASAAAEDSPDPLPPSLDWEASLAQLHVLAQRLAPSASLDPPDFYLDANADEISRLLQPLLALDADAASLLDTFPELQAISDLRDSCAGIRDLPITTPLARVIPKVEAVIAQIEDWERFSDRAHSLASRRDALTTIVVAWRRIELTSWATLLRRQTRSFAATTDAWWFRLYELLIRGATASAEALDTEADAYLREVALALDSFLRSASVGQFEARLALLKSFSDLVADLGRRRSIIWPRLRRLVLGIHFHHEARLPAILGQVHEAFKAAQAEVEDCIRLASWKDVNIVALRQSSQRSHRALLKIVRKYRIRLQQPATAVSIAATGHAPGPDAVRDRFQTGHIDLSGLDVTSTSADGIPSSVPTYLAEASATVTKLRALTQRWISSRDWHSVEAGKLRQLASDIRHTARALADEVLPSAVPDAEKHAKNLDLRKRRAFAELLRELKRIGLGHFPTEKTTATNADVLTTFAHRLLPGDGPAWSGSLINIALRRLLQSMPDLRKLAISRHPDVSSGDMQRAIGSVENGLSSVLAGHDALASLSEVLASLALHQRRLRVLAGSELIRTPQWPDAGTIRSCQILHQRAIDAMRLALQGATKQTLIPASPALEGLLAELATDCGLEADDVSAIADATSGSLKLLTASEDALLRSVWARLEAVQTRLEQVSRDFPSAAFAVTPTATRLAKAFNGPGVELSAARSDGTAWTSHATVIDSILVLAQGLEVVQVPDQNDRAHPGGVRLTQSSLLRGLQQCHPTEVLDAVDQFCSVTSTTSQSPEFLSIVCRRVAVFLDHYLDLATQQAETHRAWQAALLEFLSTIVDLLTTIGEKGFCRPSFEDKQGQDTSEKGERTNEGTGLGEGQGAKDVGDEIEGDEQLEGLQDQDEEEKGDGEDGKDRDQSGIDTQLDFDGDLESAQGSEDDQASDAEDDDEQNVEDAVGKVDPLDQGAVDEKLWQDDQPSSEEQPSAELEDRKRIAAGDTSDVIPKDDDAGKERKQDQKPDTAADDDVQPEEEAQQPGTPPAEDGGVEDGDEGEEEDVEAQQLMDGVEETDKLDLPDDIALDDRNQERPDPEDDDLSSLSGDEGGQQETPDSPGDETTDKMDEADEQPSAGLGNESGLGADSEMQDEGDRSEGARGAAGQGTGTGERSEGTDRAMERLEGQEPARPASPDQSKTGTDAAAEQDQSGELGLDDGRATADPLSQAFGEAPNRIEPRQPATAEAAQSDAARDLATSIEAFQRRLDALTEAPEDRDLNGPASEDREAPGEVAFSLNDDSRADQQMPGPATEDQAQRFSDLRLDEAAQDIAAGPEDVPPMPLPEPPSSAPQGMELDMPSPPSAMSNLDKAISARQNKPGPLTDSLIDFAQPSSELSSAMEIDEDVAPNPMDVESVLAEWRAGPDGRNAVDTWMLYERLVQASAFRLAEQLRLVLEPTTATRLQGDYRTGKRLNMRKLIPYIASDYTKDKIWLRRTRPAQRDYQIVLAIDDSRSMSDSRSAHLAFQTLALVTKGLSLLEVGDVSIMRFGNAVDVARPFGQGVALNATAGGDLLRQFTFGQQGTDVRLLVDRALQHFEDAKASARSTNADLWQLGIIVSDGICQDHQNLRALLRKAVEQRVLFVFVVLDSLHQRSEGSDDHTGSIVDMNSVKYVQGADGKLEIKMERYLDSFPFDFYIILRDVEALPDVLSSTLRQFFERVSSS